MLRENSPLDITGKNLASQKLKNPLVIYQS